MPCLSGRYGTDTMSQNARLLVYYGSGRRAVDGLPTPHYVDPMGETLQNFARAMSLLSYSAPSKQKPSLSIAYSSGSDETDQAMIQEAQKRYNITPQMQGLINSWDEYVARLQVDKANEDAEQLLGKQSGSSSGQLEENQ